MTHHQIVIFYLGKRPCVFGLQVIAGLEIIFKNAPFLHVDVIIHDRFSFVENDFQPAIGGNYFKGDFFGSGFQREVVTGIVCPCTRM